MKKGLGQHWKGQRTKITVDNTREFQNISGEEKYVALKLFPSGYM